MKTIPAITLAFLLIVCCGTFAQTKPNSRIIVTTDGEVDDMDSFIRLLLYSNELNLVGLVYSSSEFHYKGDNKGTTFTSQMPFSKQYGTRTNLRWLGTTWMQDYIDKYAAVYNNLKQHDKNYPTPQHLKSIISVGNIDFEGEMDHDTEGSDYIKKFLLDDDATPVYILMWGGTNTAARALKSIEDEYKNKPAWKAVYNKVCSKTNLYIILDQDETYKKYVSENWPGVKVIYNSTQFWCLAYPWRQFIPKQLHTTLTGAWFSKNILNNNGALVAKYFLWGDAQKLEADPEHTQGNLDSAKRNGMDQYDFLSEGDSPSYFFLINTGLRNTENPAYGGWGGRFIQSKMNASLWKDSTTVTDFNAYTNKQDFEYPQTRWIEAIQNDFAARAAWCVKTYKEANHAPVVKLVSAKDITAAANSVVQMNVSANDPDGNALTYQWWQYKEAGTYAGNVDIKNANTATASFTIPSNAKSGEIIHIIIEVKDNGTPQLTRYQRAIITVK